VGRPKGLRGITHGDGTGVVDGVGVIAAESDGTGELDGTGLLDGAGVSVAVALSEAAGVESAGVGDGCVAFPGTAAAPSTAAERGAASTLASRLACLCAEARLATRATLYSCPLCWRMICNTAQSCISTPAPKVALRDAHTHTHTHCYSNSARRTSADNEGISE
jgi:hypothetical protein